ncbi:MAG: 2-oxoacid:acceptor oxidoreductase subunit alpha [Candidatus Marinimicrobia bacterium]|nr:2-oxoacid:acceptor oxidoreductase subunit alpha [Candidatus Neomarinimicrobiota bacterium]
MSDFDLKIGIGGAAGQGIASVGNILAFIFARRGLNVWAYNAFQSIIRGGHTFLTIRASAEAIGTHGDVIDILVCLNQDTLDRHLGILGPGTFAIYDGGKIKPTDAPPNVNLIALPIATLSPNPTNKMLGNTIAAGAVLYISGFSLDPLEDALKKQFARKGAEVVAENLAAASAGYAFAGEHFKPMSHAIPAPKDGLAILNGNTALAMGGAAAGVKFYCAYPMSPSTGVLHWFAANARKLGIMVRQVEDELGVINMAIGAAHAGTRAMCATSGGGFALMTEGIGLAAMMEIPVVVINVMRSGPSTGVPTKTEQGDLWQALGASQGDFPRVIVAPTDVADAFATIPEVFNVVDRLQCPALVLTDLLISEGTTSMDPALFKWDQDIDRGELIDPARSNGSNGAYLRYEITKSGISPRALPGIEGYIHVVASDEQDEDSTLISDEFTDPHKRQAMMEKRMRKMELAAAMVPAPELDGPADADVTLVGWGSTKGVLDEATEQLNAAGTSTNHLQVKWLVPLHGEVISAVLGASQKVIIVENNYTGQFARYLRSETGVFADAHIRKYDGEPFLTHHIVEGVQEILQGKTAQYVPTHEYKV